MLLRMVSWSLWRTCGCRKVGCTALYCSVLHCTALPSVHPAVDNCVPTHTHRKNMVELMVKLYTTGADSAMY